MSPRTAPVKLNDIVLGPYQDHQAFIHLIHFFKRIYLTFCLLSLNKEGESSQMLINKMLSWINFFIVIFEILPKQITKTYFSSADIFLIASH